MISVKNLKNSLSQNVDSEKRAGIAFKVENQGESNQAKFNCNSKWNV